MRINAINTKINNYKPIFAKAVIFKAAQKTDSFEKQTEYPYKYPMSESFIDHVKDINQRELIVRNVILDSRGKYRKDVENLFLDAVDISERLIKQDKIYIDDNLYPALIESARVTFESIKNGDKFYTDRNPVGLLMRIGYIGIANGCTDLKDIFETTKSKNNKINVMEAQSIIQWQNYSTINYDAKTAQEAILKYCKQGDYIDFESIPIVASLFSAADCEDFYETDTIYNMALDNNKEIDAEKYGYIIEGMQLLTNLCNEDGSIKWGTEYGHFKKNIKDEMLYEILRTVMNNTFSKDGFTQKEGIENLKLWIEYIKKSQDLINRNTTIKVVHKSREFGEFSETMTLEDYLLKEEFPNKEFYDSPLYKLYALLCVDDNNKIIV